MRIRPLTVLLWAVLVLGLGGVTLAQGAPDEPVQTTSWFRQFMWSDSVVGLIQIWIIILLSFVGMGLIIQYAMRYRRTVVIPQESYDQINAMLTEKRYREAIDFANGDESYLSKVSAAALNEAANGYSAMERAVEEEADSEITKMLRPLEYINIIANVAPMLGLFGTVYGMIEAFNSLVASGGKPDPAKLAAGISTALVTTFWGLIVAIPCLTAYSLIRNKVDVLTSEGILMVEELIKPFKPGAAKKAPAATPAPATPKPAAPKPA